MAATKEATAEDILALALDINKNPEKILSELAEMLYHYEDESIATALGSYLSSPWQLMGSLSLMLLENKLENHYQEGSLSSGIIDDYVAVIVAFEPRPIIRDVVDELRGKKRDYLRQKTESILTQRQKKEEEQKKNNPSVFFASPLVPYNDEAVRRGGKLEPSNSLKQSL